MGKEIVSSIMVVSPLRRLNLLFEWVLGDLPWCYPDPGIRIELVKT